MRAVVCIDRQLRTAKVSIKDSESKGFLFYKGHSVHTVYESERYGSATIRHRTFAHKQNRNDEKYG
jgi:hypothetical protein